MPSHPARSPLPRGAPSMSLVPLAPLPLLSSFLLFAKERHVGSIASVLHFCHGNEMKGGGVNGVILAGGRLFVGQKMAEMGIAAFCPQLSPLHVLGCVGLFDD